MKKLLFGLIAIVMFGNFGFGNKLISNNFEKKLFILNTENFTAQGCLTFYRDVYLDGQFLQTVSMQFCCRREL